MPDPTRHHAVRGFAVPVEIVEVAFVEAGGRLYGNLTQDEFAFGEVFGRGPNGSDATLLVRFDWSHADLALRENFDRWAQHDLSEGDATPTTAEEWSALFHRVRTSGSVRAPGP